MSLLTWYVWKEHFLNIVIILSLIGSVFTGSPCPPRENIYPCSCLNVRAQGNLMRTIVQCHRLQDSNSLGIVTRFLATMKIDHFHLYDSFWHLEHSENKNFQVLPHDWVASLKSTSIEIVDTPLTSCFACDLKFPCKNIDTTRFVAINSTTSTNLCTLCPTGRNNSFAWINCMNKLKELAFNRGKISSLGADFFPSRLEGLKRLNMSYNEIRSINVRAFQSLDTLTSLDLSHNRLLSLDSLFTRPMKLEYLDVSWNQIDRIEDNFFQKLPNLKFFNVRSNHIVQLIEKHWINIPQSLKLIDLEDNPIKCNCDMKWVNSTFPEKTFVKGYCSSEKLYLTKNLKQRIKFFLIWCDKVNVSTTIKSKRITSNYLQHSTNGVISLSND